MLELLLWSNIDSHYTSSSSTSSRRSFIANLAQLTEWKDLILIGSVHKMFTTPYFVAFAGPSCSPSLHSFRKEFSSENNSLFENWECDVGRRRMEHEKVSKRGILGCKLADYRLVLWLQMITFGFMTILRSRSKLLRPFQTIMEWITITKDTTTVSPNGF